MSLNGSKSFIMDGMVINMDDARLKTLTQIEEFLKGTDELFRVSREERYPLVQRTLTRFGYDKLARKGKGVILRYLEAMTGLSRQQMTRLVQQFQKTGVVRLGYQTPRRGFQRVFGP
ncbi:integrase, catalytic region, partial [mine drainage metagenome]